MKLLNEFSSFYFVITQLILMVVFLFISETVECIFVLLIKSFSLFITALSGCFLSFF